MKSAIIGAGAIGTIVGALAAESGADIVLADADKSIVDALNKNGAIIKGNIEKKIPVKALLSSEMEGIFDIIILTTKQTANSIVLRNIISHMNYDSIVCTLQNGIPEESVAEFVGTERTVGGTVGFGATLEAPGISRFTSSLEALEKYAFKIGNIDGTVTDRVNSVYSLLSKVGGCTICTDLMSIRWTKLLVNATLSGMSAALGCTFKEVLYSDKARNCAAFVADETIKVAHACGIQLGIASGTEVELLELKNPSEAPGKKELIFKIWGPHENLKASMLQDIEKKRKTEIDYINGLVCRKGREHGIPTPFNDKVVELIKKEEQSWIINKFDEVEQFNSMLQLLV